jgi:hypothetical protein
MAQRLEHRAGDFTPMQRALVQEFTDRLLALVAAV